VITFLGSVKVETKDGLKVNTESIAYDQNNEVAQTDAPVAFERENVSGHSTGAIVYAKSKKLDLKSDVEITVVPEVSQAANVKPSSSRSRPVTIRSAQASFEQESMKLTFTGGVTAEQDRDLMSGENLYATLNQQKKIQKLEVRTNAYLRRCKKADQPRSIPPTWISFLTTISGWSAPWRCVTLWPGLSTPIQICNSPAQV